VSSKTSERKKQEHQRTRALVPEIRAAELRGGCASPQTARRQPSGKPGTLLDIEVLTDLVEPRFEQPADLTMQTIALLVGEALIDEISRRGDDPAKHTDEHGASGVTLLRGTAGL
jgi:hypothetical protein